MLMAVFLSFAVMSPAWSGGQEETAAVGEQGEITVTMLMGEHASSPIKPNAVAYEEIRKRLGIRLDIEAVPGSDFTQKKNVLLATGQMPDIIEDVSLADVVEFGKSETFLPLIKYIEDEAPNIDRLIGEFSEYKRLMVENELYILPTMAKSLDGSIGFRFPFGRQPMIRKDILEKHGLPMPDTIDELHAVLAELKELYPDKHIWTNRGGTQNLVNSTAYPLGSGGHGVYFDEAIQGGKWLFGDVTDDFRNYVMAYFRELYAQGILDPDFAINTADQWHEKLGSGKSFFYYDNMTFATNYNISLRSIDPDATFWPVPIMENAKGQRRNFFYAWFGSGHAISAKTKYPERIVQLFDWMYSDEGVAVTNYGIEGQQYSVENGEFRLLPSIIEKYRSASDPYRAFNSDTGTQELQFCKIVDTAIWHSWDPPDVLSLYEAVANDPNMVPAVMNPPFTPDEQETLKELQTRVDNILLPAMDKVIIGEISLDQFAAAQDQARKNGADKIVEIYNQAETRLQ